jgi:hypothetical protein
MNTETNTDLKTQDNTPCGSYDEKEEEGQFLRSYFAQQKSSRSTSKDDDIMYHVNPVGVMEANPDLAGKVKQAYIFCKACNKWQNLTTENSIQLPFGEFSFQKECYVGGFCWTSECNQAQYEKEEKQRADERFWAQGQALRRRCDELEQNSLKYKV